MKDDPKTMDAGTHLMFIAKNLDQVGKHATDMLIDILSNCRARVANSAIEE